MRALRLSRNLWWLPCSGVCGHGKLGRKRSRLPVDFKLAGAVTDGGVVTVLLELLGSGRLARSGDCQSSVARVAPTEWKPTQPGKRPCNHPLQSQFTKHRSIHCYLHFCGNAWCFPVLRSLRRGDNPIGWWGTSIERRQSPLRTTAKCEPMK